MINTKIFLEKFLQNQRFKILDKSFLKGNVLDFGGNEGELKSYIDGNYTLVNYDHSLMEGKFFDNIIALAVIEHIVVEDVYTIFKKFREQLVTNGSIIITTPTPRSKIILELLAKIKLLDKGNILEHRHYWKKQELFNLASESNLKVSSYKQFQFGFNQICIFNPI